jgi:uncharacterized protein (DUF697 family)/tellurite resistance protein
MTPQDVQAIIAIAALAATADGTQDPAELAAVKTAATHLGLTDADATVQRAAGGQLSIESLAAQLTSDEARKAAWDTAVAVTHANHDANDREQAFLRSLSSALKVPYDVPAMASAAAGAVTAAPTAAPGARPDAAAIDKQIMDQSIMTAACELLPDKLANLAILPLQLRMVYQIGQAHGQSMDMNQVKDLAGAFGIGVGAQMLEGLVRGTLGKLAGGLLGGFLGGAAGMASGAAVTFASTYALGHAAKQYYAQGRSMSMSDLKTLFERLKTEATALYPQMADRINGAAKTTNVSALMSTIRGG